MPSLQRRNVFMAQATVASFPGVTEAAAVISGGRIARASLITSFPDASKWESLPRETSPLPTRCAQALETKGKELVD